MVNDNLSLRISAVFIIALASFIGICFPLIFDAKINFFRVLNTGSAGVMLGLSMMHLLPSSTKILSELYPGYDWSYAIACAGVGLVLTIEQVVLLVGTSENNNDKGDFKFKKIESSPYEINVIQTAYDNDHDHVPSHEHDHDDHVHDNPTAQRLLSHDHAEHDHILGNVLNSSGLKTLITAYILEFSIAVHSVIIGVDLGLLADPSNNVTLSTLLIALSFHQFIEGIGLGSAIQASRGSLGNSKVVGFVLIFSLTMPLGIVIGILTSTAKSSNLQDIAKGIADAFATGSLLFISLTEMVANYFGASDLKKNPKLRVSMLISFCVGVLIMAVIAIWA